MAQVGYDSRSRVAIVWYDDESEAEARGVTAQNDPSAAQANIGFVQVGRDRAFDREIDGKPAFAVVVP